LPKDGTFLIGDNDPCCIHQIQGSLIVANCFSFVPQGFREEVMSEMKVVKGDEGFYMLGLDPSSDEEDEPGLSTLPGRIYLTLPKPIRSGTPGKAKKSGRQVGPGDCQGKAHILQWSPSGNADQRLKQAVLRNGE
jgi:hypothetical protein